MPIDIAGKNINTIFASLKHNSYDDELLIRRYKKGLKHLELF